jgi:hypothetical protein
MVVMLVLGVVELVDTLEAEELGRVHLQALEVLVLEDQVEEEPMVMEE